MMGKVRGTHEAKSVAAGQLALFTSFEPGDWIQVYVSGPSLLSFCTKTDGTEQVDMKRFEGPDHTVPLRLPPRITCVKLANTGDTTLLAHYSTWSD